MQKICVIGDTHFARKAEHPLLRKHITEGQEKFFDWLAEYLRSQSINTIFLTGDVHDTRVSINVEALVKTKRLFAEKMSDFDIRIVLGNHDLYYENSYDITALELFEDIPNVTVYRSGVQPITILEKQWYIFPWVIRENEEKVVKFLKTLANRTLDKRQNTVIFGHFEMFGVNMEGGNMSTFGVDPNLFLDAAKLTLSGHYHGKSNIVKGDSRLLYVGSPYPLTFANANDEHGVWIIDENLNCEFIENKISPSFVDMWDVDIEKNGIPDVTNSFLRVSVNRSISKEKEFELRSKVEAARPLMFRTVSYGGSAVEDKEKSEMEKEANNFLRMDTVSLSQIYIEHNSDTLPELSSGEDASDAIMKRVRGYSETINNQ